MSEIIKKIFWEDLKDEIKFLVRNSKEIIKRTWFDFLDELKNIY